MKSYKIGEFEFTQDKIVLGKLKQVVKILTELKLDNTKTVMGFVTVISERMGELLSIVLKGGTFASTEAKVSYFEENVTLEMLIEIVEDFLVLNPVYSLITKGLDKIVK